MENSFIFVSSLVSDDEQTDAPVFLVPRSSFSPSLPFSLFVVIIFLSIVYTCRMVPVGAYYTAHDVVILVCIFFSHYFLSSSVLDIYVYPTQTRIGSFLVYVVE